MNGYTERTMLRFMAMIFGAVMIIFAAINLAEWPVVSLIEAVIGGLSIWWAKR